MFAVSVRPPWPRGPSGRLPLVRLLRTRHSRTNDMADGLALVAAGRMPNGPRKGAG